MYNINWNSIMALLLPTFLRGERMLAWLNSLVVPVKELHGRFLAYRLQSIYRVEHTPQVYSMEKVLNERFDPLENRIYITDGEYSEQLYLFSPLEDQPIYLYAPEEDNPVYVYADNDPQNASVDFIVHLPLEFVLLFMPGSNNRNELLSLIDYYRLPDKTYTLIFE